MNSFCLELFHSLQLLKLHQGKEQAELTDTCVRVGPLASAINLFCVTGQYESCICIEFSANSVEAFSVTVIFFDHYMRLMWGILSQGQASNTQLQLVVTSLCRFTQVGLVSRRHF